MQKRLEALEFQFLLGRLETIGRLLAEATVYSFQFLLGRLETRRRQNAPH